MSVKVADLFASLKITPDPASIKAADAQLKRFGDKVEKFAKDANKAFGRGLNYVAAGIAGVLTVGAKNAIDFDRAMTRLQISSNGAVGPLGDLRERILAVSQATGLAKEQVLEGVAKFVELTGDGKAAAESMEVFAKASKATGAEIGEIAEVAASLSQQLKIAPKDFEQAFSILIAGGKAGSVEFKNMAALLSEVTAASSKFKGGLGKEGLADISAAFQIVRQGFGGPQGANKSATALVTLLAEISDKSKVLKRNGVIVWEKDKKGKEVRRNVVDIVKQIGKLSATKRAEIFGLDAGKALEELLKVDGAWDQLRESTRKANDLGRDYATEQQSNAGKIDRAWNSVQIALARAFTPERVESMANAISNIVGVVNKVIEAVGGAESAVTLLVVAWGGLKALQLAGFLTQAITKMWGLVAATQAAAASGAGLGAALGRLGLVGAAGAAGYAAGSWLSHQLNLNEGDKGYNDDYVDPAWKASRAADRARKAAATAANPGATVAVPAGGKGAPGGAAVRGGDVNVTIVASGTDPQGVVDIAKREITAHHERERRATAAALAGDM